MLSRKKHKNLAALIPKFSVGVKLEDYLLGLLDSQPVRIHNGIDRLVSSRAECVREALRNSLVDSRFDWRKMTVSNVRLEDGILNIWVRKESEETNG